ncbi:NAD(P)-binding protein [Bimuria novae-zelandiae CBS 107.79]|uniref:NAD(P)-binding protein n=1 Tax=Bimuria novae-zelandiae CBS 107.79 TaxID=1447943 RepID=A0A6A5ULJ8_9PLEO|nr:NAD(P)-binding protein [Bimuria novae-zelandiae CBS 107.79]
MAPLPKQTRQWILANPPKTNVQLDGPNATFSLRTTDIAPLADNQVLIKLKYLSNDPAQRGWIQADADADRLYAPPVRAGEAMRSYGIGEVVQSKAANLKEDTLVSCITDWQEYKVLDAAACTPIQEDPAAGIKATHYIGALGGPGITAWYGLTEVVRTTADDVVVVSGAAGSTGSMVVQIAKRVLGCKKVIGIAGGAKKCRWVESLGADICVDYKSSSFQADLAKATEGYVDVYFDNVGGHILDLMLKRVKRFGRVAACGSISTYNDPEATHLKNWTEVIMNRIEIKGFIVLDAFAKGKGPENMGHLRKAVQEGKIKMQDQEETVVQTKFEDIPRTWMMLFEGANQGKLVTELKA